MTAVMDTLVPTTIATRFENNSEIDLSLRSVSRDSPIDQQYHKFHLQSYYNFSTPYWMSQQHFLTRNAPVTKDHHHPQAATATTSSNSVHKASNVEELKNLILTCKAGTGEITRHIKEATFTPRANAFTSLLQFVSRARQPEKAVEIFQAMQTIAGITPNTFTYSALISALARVGNWQDAEQYFLQLKENAKANPELKPNTVTYASMISAYEKGRQLDKALETFDEQLRHGVDPDVITYASLLSACERAGAIDRAIQILDNMHESGLVGPPQMYNSFIASCGIRWKPALEVFLGMQCAGVEVTSQTATLLMASLCAGKQRDHALALLSQVILAGWSLSLTAYSSLLKLLSSLGDWKATDMVHSHMLNIGIHVDSTSAASIINAHALGGDEAGAERLSEYFSKIGIMVFAHKRLPSNGGNAVDDVSQVANKSEASELSVSASELTESECGHSIPISDSVDIDLLL